MTDAELQYYYFGFYRILKRYRSTSILGWAIVFVACLSVPFGWNLGRATGFVEVVLTILTILAGLAVVWQNISALEEYIRVPYPSTVNGEANTSAELIAEIKNLMKEVDDGGWQEAYTAIGKVESLRVKYSLPELKQ
jgi:ABC-type multidrug transport system fused ATPase/permease subunit